MKASKALRQPENWPDFESLCKKLWGEIWDCHEIKKNGRKGQKQHGVDVYGIPSFDTEYYGIQCKGKDLYTHRQFSESEIDKEIEEAKKFKPKLKKLYFATTAVKDATIEEHVRVRNQENKQNELFEVHIYSWEDIVELIDENKETHDWYVKSQNFKTTQACRLTFQDDSEELTVVVPFAKTYTEFKQRINPIDLSAGMFGERSPLSQLVLPPQKSPFHQSVNHSYCSFYLRLHNTGTDPIEEYKIFLDFKGNFQSVETATKGDGIHSIGINYDYDTYIDSEKRTGRIDPDSPIIVGDDIQGFDDIDIKPNPEPEQIRILWKLVSKHYKDEGELKLNIEIEIKPLHKTVLVDDPLKVGTTVSDIHDYVEE